MRKSKLRAISKGIKRGQAMVEYVILLGMTAVGLSLSSQLLQNAIMALFETIGEFFAKKGP